MKEISLTQGKFVQVDDEDFSNLSKFSWYAVKAAHDFYAARRRRLGEGVGPKHVLMHRFLVSCPDGMQVHHKDGDTMNNQKSNLEVCTQKENLSKRKFVCS